MKKNCKNCIHKDFHERFKYLQADFDNYKKYVDKEREKFEKRANGELIRELLAVVDDLEIGFGYVSKDAARRGNLSKQVECRLVERFDVLRHAGPGRDTLILKDGRPVRSRFVG